MSRFRVHTADGSRIVVVDDLVLDEVDERVPYGGQLEVPPRVVGLVARLTAPELSGPVLTRYWQQGFTHLTLPQFLRMCAAVIEACPSRAIQTVLAFEEDVRSRN